MDQARKMMPLWITYCTCLSVDRVKKNRWMALRRHSTLCGGQPSAVMEVVGKLDGEESTLVMIGTLTLL